MSGWDAPTWANAILTGIYVLIGLALLLWRPKPGTSWWSWQRLFGAAFIVGALLLFPIIPNPTRGGLVSNGILMTAMGLVYLLAGLWSVHGPDLPARAQLRQRAPLSAFFFLYGGGVIALGLTIPR